MRVRYHAGFCRGEWRTVISALWTSVLASTDDSAGGKTARYCILTAVAEDLKLLLATWSGWKPFPNASLFQHCWQRDAVQSTAGSNTSRTGGASAVLATPTSAMGWLSLLECNAFQPCWSSATPETIPSVTGSTNLLR